MEGGARHGLTRARRDALDDADPLAGFRERFVIDDDAPALPRRQLARPAARRARASGCTRVIDQWGEELVGGWHDWIEAPDAGRRRARRGARRAPRRGARRRLDTVNLFKLVNAVLDADPSLALAGHRPGQLPDRPLRARGDRARPRPGAADLRGADPLHGPQPGDLPRDGLSCSRTSPTAGARWPTWRRSTRPARSSGTSRHSAGAVPVELDASGRRATPSAAPTSTSTPARARRPTCTSREPAGRAAHADPGLVRPGRPVRDGAPVRAARRHQPLPRRHAADPRPGRGRGGRADHRRGGHRGAAREVDRADRADDRAARRVAGAARLRRSARRATRACAAPTCRCATRRRGRSAAR